MVAGTSRAVTGLRGAKEDFFEKTFEGKPDRWYPGDVRRAENEEMKISLFV